MASDELRNVLSPLLWGQEPRIWITENSYARLYNEEDEDDHRSEKQFELDLTDTRQCHELSIHASTLEEAIICLDYLVGLKDTHFKKMDLTYKDYYDVRLCPFGVNILEKILQNSERRIRFNYMIFTPDHSRTLATSGTKTDIEFRACEFQDEGAAFVEASASRRDVNSGPAKLCISGGLAFNDRNWALFLNQLKLDSLELSIMSIDCEVSCRAVATAEVQCLTLGDELDLEDGGAALVESVRQGRGPKELCFAYDAFDSSERLITFMNALRGNMNLERLQLRLGAYRQVTKALAAALHENKGLVHLNVYVRALDGIGRAEFFEGNETDWTETDNKELLESISLHPSLRSLDLKLDRPRIDAKKRREFTKAVAEMLSINKRIEEMSFDGNTFDKDDWNTNVVPRLECNHYRKWLSSIQKIEEASTRAAVLTRAVAKFASKPHLLWMLLNQNHDIVSSYLDSANDLNLIPPRKRSRSPSLDGMSAH
jgi:hypothetical protein